MADIRKLFENQKIKRQKLDESQSVVIDENATVSISLDDACDNITVQYTTHTSTDSTLSGETSENCVEQSLTGECSETTTTSVLDISCSVSEGPVQPVMKSYKKQKSEVHSVRLTIIGTKNFPTPNTQFHVMQHTVSCVVIINRSVHMLN